MDEIARTFGAAGLPGEFHEAAAEVYRRSARHAESGGSDLDRALAAIRDES